MHLIILCVSQCKLDALSFLATLKQLRYITYLHLFSFFFLSSSSSSSKQPAYNAYAFSSSSSSLRCHLSVMLINFLQSPFAQSDSYSWEREREREVEYEMGAMGRLPDALMWKYTWRGAKNDVSQAWEHQCTNFNVFKSSLLHRFKLKTVL
jgi:hypothetical protein